MKTNRIAVVVLAASFFVVAGYSQTASELLQKGIYTQETAGDLDGAISIYHQIVDSGSSPRDIAAQAQYRLSQSLLQKGDLAGAAHEFDGLARNYADYAKLVSSMASMAQRATIPASGLTPEQQAADRAKLAAAAVQGGGPVFRVGTGASSVATPDGTSPATPLIRIGSNVATSNLVSQVAPVYPPLAKAARVQGVVRFDATIGKDGHVENLTLVSGPPLLVQAAMEAARQSVYRPTLLNGQPVSVITTVDENFTLSQ